MRRRLPRGVALVRIETPFGRLLWVSDRLSEAEAQGARVIAARKIREGAKAVVLREIEVALIVADA